MDRGSVVDSFLGLSPAKMQQMWKELANGTGEDKSSSKGVRDSCAKAALPGRQSGDQQTSSPRAERYEPCVGAANTRREPRRGCLILSLAASKTCHPQTPSPSQHPGGKLFAFCGETSLFNSPRDNIFCFVCLLCAPTPETERRREKSLHDYMSQIKSK